MANVGSKLKEISKEKSKKEKWIIARTWISVMMSWLYPDRGKIPENIGNNIFIGNNQYVTKNSISSTILVYEFTEDTPIGLMSKLMKDVKTKVEGVLIDWSIKDSKYVVDLASRGLESRKAQWISTMDNTHASARVKSRAARLLYTCDVAEKKEMMLKSHIYITIRAVDGGQLKRALTATKMYLAKIKCEFKVIKSDLITHMEYFTIMSDFRPDKVRDIPYNITSAQTLAELLPSIQGENDPSGLLMGIDRRNRSSYFINFRATAKAKNIYVVGPSGFGKTFLVLNWLLDGYATGYNICTMDLKGNEFLAFTTASNGVTISFRPDSPYFINTFVMKHNKQVDPIVYYNERFKLSKQIMLILADLSESTLPQGDSLLEEFLKSVYMRLGVLPDNPNSWERTHHLNPYVIYEEFFKYLSAEVRSKYSTVADSMLSRYKIYMDKAGSQSHIFREEYRIENILDSKVLNFDFGILSGNRIHDPAVFKVRVLFMRLINDEFVRHKKSLGQWVIKIDEESQIAEDFLLQLYSEDFTLRRAQNQINVLLGNSVSAIKDNPVARPILDNINILVIGNVSKSSRDFLVQEYSLEDHEKTLIRLATDSEYEYTFLLVNRMQKDSTTALIKSFVPSGARNGKIFKVVDIEEEGD